jgi:flagellar biosynthesis protein FliR
MPWQSMGIDGAVVMPQLGVWAMILLRMQGLSWTAPCWVVPGLDWRFRITLGLMLGVILIPIVAPWAEWPSTASGVTWAVISELLVGSVLGWSASLVIAGARQAGELVAGQAGLAAISWFDPETGDSLTPLGQLYGLLALATFLLLDGPLALIDAMVEGFRTMPAGHALPIADIANRLFEHVAQALELALRASAPVALALVLVGLVLAWLARTAASVPFAALSLPIRAMVGILLTALGVATLAATLIATWQQSPWRL